MFQAEKAFGCVDYWNSKNSPISGKHIFHLLLFLSSVRSLERSVRNIEFIQGTPDNLDVANFTDVTKPTLIVIDDMRTCLTKGVLAIFPVKLK